MTYRALLILLVGILCFPYPISTLATNESDATCYSYAYDDWSFSTLPESDVSDIETNNTYIWTLGVATDSIHRYHMNGTYDNWSISLYTRQDIGPVGLDFNGTHFFWSCNVHNRVHAVFENGTKTGFSFSVSAQTDIPHGLLFNGTYFWVGGGNKVFRYLANGTYDHWEKTLPQLHPTQSAILGLECEGRYWYVLEKNLLTNEQWVWRYDANWNYANWYLDVAEQDGLLEGVAHNGTRFWTIGNRNDRVYRYAPRLGEYIVLDQTITSNPRVELGTEHTIGYHLTWAHDCSDAGGYPVVVNGTEYLTDEHGWATFPVSYNSLGKRVWVVTNYDIPSTLNPCMIWDQVNIQLLARERMNMGALGVSYNAVYESDTTDFVGSIELNDTRIPQTPGEFGYKVASITDASYGLTNFVSNEISVIYDLVNVTLTTPKTRINVGENATLNWTGFHEYDESILEGLIILNDTTTHDTVGSYEYSAKRVVDRRYLLTAFTSNTVEIVFDRIKIIDGGVSQSFTEGGKPVTVWFIAVYEYNCEPFDDTKGTLYVNGTAMHWSSETNQWEYQYSLDETGSRTFTVTGISDEQYGLTAVTDDVGAVFVEWNQEPAFFETPLGIAGIIGSLIVVIVIIILVKKR